MKRVLLCAAALLAISTAAMAGLVNGDFSTGDESGWNRWRAPWSGGDQYAITPNGPTPFEATASGGVGSFGWWQAAPCPVGWTCRIKADWTGNIASAGWCEVMLFSVAPGTSAATIVNRIDAGAAADIAYKKDSWGMNPPTAWNWEPASNSPHPSGNGGSVTSLGWVVVATKLGSVSGAQVFASYDNFELTCVPEPGSLLVLGTGLLGALGLLKRR